MTPTKAQIKRWQRHLANERAEAAVYREIAHRKEGEEREILLTLADAESRHEEHWRGLLGEYLGPPRQADFSTRIKVFFARHFGSVFALALMQAAETRTPYEKDADATEQMSADERIHAEVVRGLAARGREQMSGNFRAAVFGMNDGLVSNLALVLGVAGSGVSNHYILLTGVSGLLAGALSMGAGEYVSVSSQRELLDASTPNPKTADFIPQLDVDANELALVYRARGMAADEATRRAKSVLEHYEHPSAGESFGSTTNEVVGSGSAAAISSFLFFASGALIPIIPFLFLTTMAATVVACVAVGLFLMLTGGVVGVLSGAPPLPRALRQLGIGLGAAGITYLLGMLFGGVVG